jgi:hypothetical protein
VRWGADGAKEGAVAFVAERVDCCVWEGGAGLLKGFEASFEVDKVEFELEGG